MTDTTVHRLDVAWLSRGALARLLAMLDREGEEARVIGGAVRNALLGETPGDLDVATTALPEEVMRRAEAAGFKPVPTGIDHGTVTVVIDARPFEVTTLREDVETFGRKAKVAFGRDWKVDAERRDFTMNALSLSPDGVVHDYVGGLDDLRARRVRFIGDPARRIEEDHLRILRFFRFHAAYGHGAPDPAGLHACIVARNCLEKLSRERVRMEILKLLLAPQVVGTLTIMSESGLLAPVLGGVAYLASSAKLVEVELAADVAPDALRRLGALGAWVSEDAERLWQKMRLSNLEHARLASMADRWWHIAPVTGEHDARALLYRIGPERFTDRVLLAWSRSRSSASDAGWLRLVGLPSRWGVPVFPVRAGDLMARGVSRGPGLGQAMRAAEEAWIAADFPNDPRSLDEILGAAARAGARDS